MIMYCHNITSFPPFLSDLRHSPPPNRPEIYSLPPREWMEGAVVHHTTHQHHCNWHLAGRVQEFPETNLEHLDVMT